MTGSADIAQTERVREYLSDRNLRVVDAERRAEVLVGMGFIASALVLASTAGGERPFSLSLALLYVFSVAAIGAVRFEIGAGFTVPTQVVFVPMLFVLPPRLVPLLVAAALALGMLPGIVLGRIPPSRILTAASNSWFAVGPAFVLAVTHASQPDSEWGILALALLAQFTCDFAANDVRERLRGGIAIPTLAEEMRQVYLIDLALSPVGLLVALATIDRHWAVLLIAPLFGMLQWLSNERRSRIEQLIELNDAYRGTALLLGDVVEADDTYTGEHCKDVVLLALEVARRLGLGAAEQRQVEFAALLHDVGKIAVPKAIVNKPGKLDPDEWEIIKTHTTEGQRMLEQVGGFMRDVGEIVRSHHERWDGGGYPDGLRGEDIPLPARIVSCCDAFNAITTSRSYRKANTVAAAIAELHANAGTQFDPVVVETLVAAVADEWRQ
jgi:putative nucleotidyltransferase with HDIG domain